MSVISRMIDYVSGKYIKTVSNQTIFGEGNIAGGGPGGSASWGDIVGTLSNQTDLKSELDNKLDKLTDAGEFVYTHEGSTQNSKGFIAGDTLLNSSAHIASAHTTYKAIQDLINDTVQDLTHTWSSEKINSLLTAALDCQVVATMPTNPTDNTLYLVGPKGTSPNIYYEKKLRVDGVTYDAGTTNIDLSGYYNKTQVDNKLDDKQDTLVSGTNIKTINNNSILGSGNIEIQGGVGTETTLWSGNISVNTATTVNLLGNMFDYDYIRFECQCFNSYSHQFTYSSKYLQQVMGQANNKSLMFYLGWGNSSYTVIEKFTATTITARSDTASFVKVVGIKGNVDISTLSLEQRIQKETVAVQASTWGPWAKTITLPDGYKIVNVNTYPGGSIQNAWVNKIEQTGTSVKLEGNYIAAGAGSVVLTIISLKLG